MDSNIELRLPADRQLMLVARMTVAGVATKSCMTLGCMDTLKHAVEEACMCLIERDDPPAELLLRFSLNDILTVEILPDTPIIMDSAEKEIVESILASATDGATMLMRDDKLFGIAICGK